MWFKQALSLATLLFAAANAAAVQNGITYPNADFYVTFYSYNVTGFMTIVSFVPGLVCSIDANSLAGPGNISVVLWRDAGNAGCVFVPGCFDTLINSIGHLENPPALNTLVILAVDSESNEYSDNWQMSLEMVASGILFTSMRNDSWSQLSLDLPLTLTSGWNIWQANYLSSGNKAYIVVMAVTWGILSLSFLVTLIDHVVAMIAERKLVSDLAKELNFCGFISSTIFFGLFVTRATYVFDIIMFTTMHYFAALTFSLITLYIGFVVTAFKWLGLCRDTKRLSAQFVKITSIILGVLFAIALVDLVVFGAYFAGASIPSNQHSVLDILAIILMITTIAFAVTVSVCFGNIWSALNLSSSLKVKNSHRRVWKLTFLSIGSVVSLFVIVLFLVLQAFVIETVQVSIAIDCFCFLSGIPVLISWLSLSGLWTRTFQTKDTQDSSIGSHSHRKESGEGLDKKRQSSNHDLLEDSPDGFLKGSRSSQVYEIGELHVEI